MDLIVSERKLRSQNFIPNFPSQRQIDVSTTSPNQYDVSIVWLDTKMDPQDLRTRQLLSQLNDRVELFNDLVDCVNYLRDQLETILFIVSGKCAEQCLGSVHSFACIDSIIIYCASPEKYRHLTRSIYMKTFACVSTESELIEKVRSWVSLKCQPHIYAWNRFVDNGRSVKGQTALFLAHYLLVHCTEYLAFRQRKEEMLNICREYYAQRPRESALIEEFELTYTPADSIMWFTRNSFLHKTVNRAFRSFDKAKLSVVAFYIQDLRDQLKENRFKTDSSEQLADVYHGLVMPKLDVEQIQSLRAGCLLTVNGFLSTSRILQVAQRFAEERRTTSLDHSLCYVLLHIHLNVEQSPVIFADIREFSAYPTEEEVLFDLGTVFCIQSVSYSDDTRFWSIHLTLASHDDYQSIDKLVKMVQNQYGEESNADRYITLIDNLLALSASDEGSKGNEIREQSWSLLRQNANSNLWGSRSDRYKLLFEGAFKHLLRTVFNHFYLDSSVASKASRSTAGAIEDLFPDQSFQRSRFEPVIIFRLDNAASKEERTNLSRHVSFAYRRFISEHLTPDQVNAHLDEFALICYVSAELPSYMKDRPCIKFYPSKLPVDKNDQRPPTEAQIMERFLSQLFQDLGMFYMDKGTSLPSDPKHQPIRKRLLEKAAQCYQAMLIQADGMIQRYQKKD